MSANLASHFVDGVASTATHNGVHRVVFFRLNASQEAEPVAELVIPDQSLAALTRVLATIGSSALASAGADD